MTPSSRTPEGEPCDCDVCGFASVVEPSTPPGDAVCPRCGSHLWVDASLPRESPTKLAIRDFVRELQSLVSDRDSTDYAVGFLVTGLRRCLVAHGASLWIVEGGTCRTIEGPQLVRNEGQTASSDFARETISTNESLCRIETLGSPPFLHLGVPIASQNRTLGAIEIAQRYVRDTHIQRGYLQFICQMADVTAPLAARLSGG